MGKVLGSGAFGTVYEVSAYCIAYASHIAEMDVHIYNTYVLDTQMSIGLLSVYLLMDLCVFYRSFSNFIFCAKVKLECSTSRERKKT